MTEIEPFGPLNIDAVESVVNEPLARRHRAAQRLSPLSQCGCVRDPLYDHHHRCEPEAEVNDREAEAAAAAIAHLDRRGTPALVDAPTCDALWRNGYRRLATTMRQRRTGGAA